MKTKSVLINLKINAETRDQFRLVAELRGSTMSNLLHQFIVQSIWEEKKKHPEAFTGLETEAAASTSESSELDKSADQQPKKKSPDPEPKNVGFRIVGIVPGPLDPPPRKFAPAVEEKTEKKKGPRNEG